MRPTLLLLASLGLMAACTRDYDGDGYDFEVDCDDQDASIHPDATEVCNGLDDDCDGQVDDADDSLDTSTGLASYGDADADGAGDVSDELWTCALPEGRSLTADDCDDAEATTWPGADEYCDTVDNDCDGDVDEDSAVDATTWYADTDSDGFGDPDVVDVECTVPSGYVADATDCDDAEASTWPGADEYCDEVDNDCDGDVDEMDAVDATLWYSDGDGDGYGLDDSDWEVACEQPSGMADNNDDCDDEDWWVNPGIGEFCDDVDNDCDPTTPEITGGVWFMDTTWTATEFTSTFEAGGSLTLSDEGKLGFCSGDTYDLELSIEADVDLLGDATLTEPISIDDTGLDVVIRGLTLEDTLTCAQVGTRLEVVDAHVDADDLGIDLDGCELYVDGVESEGPFLDAWSGSIEVVDSVIDDFIYYTLHIDGDMLIEDSEISIDEFRVLEFDSVEIVDSVITHDGLELHLSSLDVSGSTFVGEGEYAQLALAGRSGAAGSISMDASELSRTALRVWGSCNLDLVDTQITDVSSSSDSVYALTLIPGASATCTGSTANSAGFQSNDGAVYMWSGSSFTSDTCDFGTSSGGDDNTVDVRVYSSSTAYTDYTAGDDESFTCSGGSCVW